MKTNTLQSRIKELRKINGLSQAKMADLLRQKYGLKTDRVMISKWETGFQTPEIYTISCIADLFNVSLDYLNGQDETVDSHRMKIFAQRLKKVLETRNIKQGELSKKTNISESLISQYLSGCTMPNYDKLNIIAKTLDVSIDWLTGLSFWNIPLSKEQIDKIIEANTSETDSMDDIFFKLSELAELPNFEELTEAEQKIIDNYRLLNDEGRKKAETYVSDLTTIPKYLEE